MPPLPSSFKAIPNQSSCSLMWKECQKFYLKDANRGPNTSFVVNDFLDNSNNNFFVIVMGDFLKCFKVTVMHCPTLTLQEHIIKNRFFDNPGIYLLHQVINEVFWSVLKFFKFFVDVGNYKSCAVIHIFFLRDIEGKDITFTLVVFTCCQAAQNVLLNTSNTSKILYWSS